MRNLILVAIAFLLSSCYPPPRTTLECWDRYPHWYQTTTWIECMDYVENHYYPNAVDALPPPPTTIFVIGNP